ncbi:hypothetical protein POM88_009088 [Heracleum sosnowskyi]|uniref:DUF8039 domain-containing protein n=1 Tax=Heracleum sosnowskyi TaxID=360622 RepID=A0AAD8N2C6_9APIA|nr:hypothetical protein POM88_009088 [Heracleum sosnowskyi]
MDRNWFVDEANTDVMEDTDTDGGRFSVEKDIPNVINEDLRDHPDMHENLKDDAELPLWHGCTQASRLSALLTLYNLKVGHQIYDAFFSEMLRAVSEILPDGNVLPPGENNPVVTRLDAWEYARRNADGVVDDPVTLQVLEDVITISDQLPEHELTKIGTDDLLARLIPLEYSGRVRAVGWGVTKTSLQAVSSVSEISKLKNDISFLKNEIKEMKRKGYIPGVQSGGSSHMDNFDIDDDVDGEHDGNHDDVLSENLLEGKNACYLYLEPNRRNVGKGVLWKDPNDRILHGVPLEEEYVRVQFEVAVPSEYNTQLPTPCDEAALVREDPGYFIAWPLNFFLLLSRQRQKPKNKEKGKCGIGQEKVKDKENEKEKTLESTGVVSSRQLGYPLSQDVCHDGVVELVRVAIVFDRVTDIQIEMGPFWDGNPWTEHINKENVLEVLNEQ